jgi:hypothetical protein
MDAEKVMMLCLSCGLAELPPDLQAMADDPDWWARLEETPEDELDADQQRMISALGVDLDLEG